MRVALALATLMVAAPTWAQVAPGNDMPLRQVTLLPAPAVTEPSQVVLEQPRPLYERPMFWAIAGTATAAVIAGVVTGLVVALRPADRITQTQACGGPCSLTLNN